jgi:hypothetical protein
MTNNSEICIRFADKSKEKIIGSITEFHGILLNLVFDKEILCFCGNTAFSIFLCNMNFCNVNYEENILGLFFKKNESSLACNENESDSQGNGHSSVESQESISRMSISIYDEIETCIDREDRSHISPTTDDIHDERRSETCLFGATSNPSTERTSVFGEAITTTDDESRPFLTDLDSHVEQHVQDEPFTNDASKPSFYENTEAPCQSNLKVYPGTGFGSRLRRFKSSWYSEYKWLEYNKELHACFCFICRLFLPNLTDTAFTKTGFRDRKHAKEKGLSPTSNIE